MAWLNLLELGVVRMSWRMAMTDALACSWVMLQTGNHCWLDGASYHSMLSIHGIAEEDVAVVPRGGGIGHVCGIGDLAEWCMASGEGSVVVDGDGVSGGGGLLAAALGEQEGRDQGE